MAEPTVLEDNNLNLAYPDNFFTEFISRTDLNPGGNKLSFFHLNIRSLRLNFDKFKILLGQLSFKPTVFALSEVMLGGKSTNTYELENYKFFMKCRPNTKRGGVSIYLLNSCECEIVAEFDNVIEEA